MITALLAATLAVCPANVALRDRVDAATPSEWTFPEGHVGGHRERKAEPWTVAREAMEALKDEPPDCFAGSGALKLGEDGLPDPLCFGLAGVAHDLRLGSRDFSATGFFREDWPKWQAFSPGAQRLALRFHDSFASTIEAVYALPEHRLLHSTTTNDYWSSNPSLARMIRHELFIPVSRDWIAAPQVFSVEGRTRITAATSRSPLKELLGDGAERMIYWQGQFPDLKYLKLDRFRIAMNIDAGRAPRSLELMYRAGHRWHPAYFERMYGVWMPKKTFQGRPVRAACLRCHYDESRPEEISPRPAFLRTREALEAVGYRLPKALFETLLQHGR